MIPRAASRYRRACAASNAPRSRKTSAASASGGAAGPRRPRTRHTLGVVVLGRHRVETQVGRDSAFGSNRAKGRKLGVAVEPVARLRLERRRPPPQHPAAMPPDRLAELFLVGPRVARTSTGSRRRPRAAPRSSRRRRAARTPRPDLRRSTRACGSRRARHAARPDRRAPPRRRRAGRVHACDRRSRCGLRRRGRTRLPARPRRRARHRAGASSQVSSRRSRTRSRREPAAASVTPARGGIGSSRP